MSFDKFYGLYRGICIDNADPKEKLRIRVQIPQLFGGSVTNWAEACVPVGAEEPPLPGSPVWVAFDGGDPNFPVWLGVSV